MALYPDEQDKLFEQLLEIIPDPDQDAPYSDYGLFTRAIAIFHETLRLYPAVVDIPKQVSIGQDTILPCSERGPGGATSIFVPKGTFIDIDVQSVHHDRNSEYIELRTQTDIYFCSLLLAGSRRFSAGSIHRHERLQMEP